MIFAIDPGHHRLVKGKRSPEIGDGIGVIEYQFNLACAAFVCTMLRKAGLAAFSTMHETDPVNKSIRKRKQIAVGAKASALISIHANAIGRGPWSTAARGNVEFHNSKGAELAVLIAAEYQAEFGDELPPRRGGVILSRPGEKKYIVETNAIPAVLVETAFMTHRLDAALLAAHNGPQRFAAPIVAGCVRWAERRSKCLNG